MKVNIFLEIKQLERKERKIQIYQSSYLEF